MAPPVDVPDHRTVAERNRDELVETVSLPGAYTARDVMKVERFGFSRESRKWKVWFRDGSYWMHFGGHWQKVWSAYAY